MSLAEYSHVDKAQTLLGAVNYQLNTEVSVTFRVSHMLFIMMVLGLTSAYAIRYRVSRTYSRLSKDLDNNEEDDQSIAADMWKETNDLESDTGISDKPVSSHFDEFLKAIKVFGYLEHDVFTELTKTTQTIRVQTNEIVKLQQLGGFAVVISGSMKVYCKSSECDIGSDVDSNKGSSSPSEMADNQEFLSNYDLLNEINVSAPISSLSSILSLFSETIQLNSPPTEFDNVNATVLAVASEPSTIVVIPAEAFKDLTHKFPQAAASIVQVILFRWSQITVRTCQKYLNLTQEFYGTERILNKTAQERIEQRLPRELIANVVRKMKKLSEESQKDIFELRSYRMNDKFDLDDQIAVEEDDMNDVDLWDETNSSDKRTVTPPAALKLNTARERSKSFGKQSSYLNLPMLPIVNSGGTKGRPSSYRNFSMDEIPEDLKTEHMIKANKSNDKHEPKQPLRDPEEFALRRAIVETMFTTIRVDSPFAFPKDFMSNDNCDCATNELKMPSSLSEKAQKSTFTFKDHDQNDSPVNASTIPIQRNDSFMVKNRQISHLFTIDRSKNSDEEKLSAVTEDLHPEKSPLMSYSDVIDETSEIVELYWYKKGQYVSKYGDKCCGIVYVLDGLLEVGYHSSPSDRSTYKKLYDVEPGQITGFLETISSYSSFVDLKAKKDTCIALISKNYFEKLAETYPLLYITAAKALTTSLTRPIVQLDFALEWISIKSGRKLISEGQTANAIYFVLNGRMRVYDKTDVIGDYGQGSTIGELETMSGEKYPGSVIAVRDTELSRFPKTLVECLARQHPSVSFEMSRMVVQAMRLRNLQTTGETNISDFKTFAILRTSPNLPVENFAIRLSEAFSDLGKDVTVLTHAEIMRYLGKYSQHKMRSLRLKAYLADLEEKNDIILYVADSENSSQWSRTCIDQADCCLLLADGSAPSVFSDVEKMVVKSPTSSRAHLILLHNEMVVPHGSTAKWLKHRPWISAHYHVQIPFASDSHAYQATKSRVQRKINQIKTRVQDELRVLQIKKEVKIEASPNHTLEHLKYKNDFNRLARVLAGEAVGLVLGGGGARGISHVGVLQALEEAGVPIDLVGGTSIGSFIGGLYAKEYDIVPLMRKSKLFSVKMSSFWRLLLDLTYPMTAWTTGHAFNSAVWKCLGDSRIEDFWVRFFTNTTNLTDSKMEVHDKGYAWRFIRASMSLAGLLPPLEENGKMLLDGGYVDNLPVSEMKKRGARYIIAVDVGAVDDTTPIKYGDTLSGFGALLNKFNPFSTTPNVPNIAEIQQRLTYVSSVKALEEAKDAPDVIYMRPPIDNYATLDFTKFHEIREVGFLYAKKKVEEEIAKGTLPSIRSSYSKRNSAGPYAKYRRYSF